MTHNHFHIHAFHTIAEAQTSPPLTFVHLPRCGQVGDTRVRAHQHIGRMEAAVQKAPLGLREVDAAEGRLWQVVVRDEAEAVDADLVDRVDRLQDP